LTQSQIFIRNPGTHVRMCGMVCLSNYRDTLNLAILCNDEISTYNFNKLCNQLAIHFAHLVCTNFSEKNKNAKIAKFIASLNLCTLRYIHISDEKLH